MDLLGMVVLMGTVAARPPCTVKEVGWDCKIENQDTCEDLDVNRPNNEVKVKDFLRVTHLEEKYGKYHVNNQKYFPKPAVTWRVLAKEDVTPTSFQVEYFREIKKEDGRPSDPICYSVSISNRNPSNNVIPSNVTTRNSPSMVTVTMDNFDHLTTYGYDAALVRVYSEIHPTMPPIGEFDTTLTPSSENIPYYGEVLIDSPENGLPKNGSRYLGELVMVIQTFASLDSRIVVDFTLRSTKRPSYSYDLYRLNGTTEKIVNQTLRASPMVENGMGRFEFSNLSGGSYKISLYDRAKVDGSYYKSRAFKVPLPDVALPLVDDGFPLVPIALGVAGGVLLVLLIIVVVIIRSRRKQKRGGRPNRYNQHLSFPNPRNDVRTRYPRTNPKVYVIYYPDDRHHREVVFRASDFLKYVGCDVRMDILDQKQIRELNKAGYVQEQWKTADCVLVINSEGAYASFHDNVETSSDNHPADGTFQPTMQALNTWATVLDSRRKDLDVFFVSFTYTDKNFQLFSRYTESRLPDNLQNLCSEILQDNGNSLPNGYKKSQEYKLLKKAIEKAEYFYKHGCDPYNDDPDDLENDHDRLDSGIGPSVDDETRPHALNTRLRGGEVKMNFFPPQGLDSSINSQPAGVADHQNHMINNELDQSFVSPLDNSFSTGYPADSCRAEPTSREDLTGELSDDSEGSLFQPPVDRSSSHGSFDGATDPLVHLLDTRGATGYSSVYHPNNSSYLENQSIQNSTRPNIRGSIRNQSFPYPADRPSSSASFPPGLAGSMCAQGPGSSLLGHWDNTDAEDMNFSTGKDFAAPSDTEASGSILSFQQDLDLARVNMEDDWSS